MLRAAIVLVGLVLLLAVLRVAVWPDALPAPWMPDGFLWLVLFLALFGTDRQTVLPAVGIGLFKDCLSVTPLGASAVLYAIVYRVVHARRHHVQRRHVRAQLAVGLVAASACAGLYAVGLWLSGSGVSASGLAVRAAAIVVPTAVLAPVALRVFGLVFRIAGMTTPRGDVVLLRVRRGPPLRAMFWNGPDTTGLIDVSADSPAAAA